MTKLETLLAYIAARASEASTWQGVAFVLSVAGSKYANLDWGQCAAIGGFVSAAIKILLPNIIIPKVEQ